MRPALALNGGLVLAWLATAPAIPAQHVEPLRKTDLIRLLTGGTMSTSEIADLVKRYCVSFTPTARDRENLTALGADSTLLARIDQCLRKRSTPPAPAAVAPAPRPAPPAAELLVVPLVTQATVAAGGVAEVGVALKRGSQAVPGTRLVLQGTAALAGGRDAEAVTDARGVALFRFSAGSLPGVHRLKVAAAGGSPVATVADIDLSITPVSKPASRPAAGRSGIVVGLGQHGVVGQRAALPVIFEARDSQGVVVPGIPVQWRIANGQLVGPSPATDSTGQARAAVVYGQQAGPTVVTVAAGGIVSTAGLVAAPGPPARLVVQRGGALVEHQLLVSSEGTTLLRVYCRDGFDNALPLTGLVAVAGDQSIVRVTAVTVDTVGGWVTLRPGKDGITNLTVQGSGIRADLSAMVRH